jgi:hypothetical protein
MWMGTEWNYILVMPNDELLLVSTPMVMVGYKPLVFGYSAREI